MPQRRAGEPTVSRWGWVSVVVSVGETDSAEHYVRGLSVRRLGASVALAGEAEEEVRLGVVTLTSMMTTVLLLLLAAVA
jgi:hypothetical protein